MSSPPSPAPTTAAGEHQYDLAGITINADHPRRAAQGEDGQPAAGHPPGGRPRRRDPTDPRADLPHLRPPARSAGADLTVAGGQLLPLRPHPLRPARPGLLRRHALITQAWWFPQPGRERPPPPRSAAPRSSPLRPRPSATPSLAALRNPSAQPAGHHHQPDDQRPGRPGRGRLGLNSTPPRTTAAALAACTALGANTTWKWSAWKPRSSRSPTPSGWPPITPRPPWPWALDCPRRPRWR